LENLISKFFSSQASKPPDAGGSSGPASDSGASAPRKKETSK
jgi:hypothetical protein